MLMVQPWSVDDPSKQRSPDDYLGFTVVRLAHILQRRMDSALQAELGVSVRQFGALSYLAADPGIGSGALARKLLITPQSAGPLVDELVKRGLVLRDGDARAGTRKAVRLTPEGEDALQRGYAVAERLREEDEADLTADQAELVRSALSELLKRLITASGGEAT